MAGFWMARVLTRPFTPQAEKFRSTFLIDFVSSGVIGLLYTLIVGPLTDSVAGTVGRALYRVAPGSLKINEYTVFQQHLRPLELMLLAAATWWILNRLSQHEQMTQLGGVYEEPDARSNWFVLITVTQAVGLTAVYLLILAGMFSLMESLGFDWTLPALAVGTVVGIVVFVRAQRAGRQGFTTLFRQNDDASAGPPPANGKSSAPPD